MKLNKKKFILLFIAFITIIILAISWLLSGSPIIDTGIAKLSKEFTGHSAPVWAVRFSPDEKLIASGSVDSTVIIRDRNSGKILQTFKHPQGVTNIDFSPDGKFLVSSSYDAKVRLWNVADGSLIKTFEGHTGTVWTVAYSPGGTTIAAAGDDKTIMIWDIASGNVIHVLKGHTLNIWSVKFSPDGNVLASGSFDDAIKIWDVKNGALIRTISGHTQAVVDLAFSHSGKTIASTSDDKTIRIWNAADGALIKTMEVPEHVQAVAFSPDDKYLMTGGRDKTMAGELLQNFTGDSERFKGVSARLWDIEKGIILQTFSSHKNDVNDVAFSNDGLWIATASADWTVQLWKLMK